MLDHLIYGVPVLADGVNQFESCFGVRAQPGGKHQGLGTHNALLGLGQSTYLEIIAPDPDQPVPAMPRPFGLDSLAGPRLVGWAIRCDDIDARVARARAQGYDPGTQSSSSGPPPKGSCCGGVSPPTHSVAAPSPSSSSGVMPSIRPGRRPLG